MPGAIGAAAALHGGDLLRLGFTVSQVVHDYGDVCQSITDLALETGASINVDDADTLQLLGDDSTFGDVCRFSDTAPGDEVGVGGLRLRWDGKDHASRYRIRVMRIG